MTATEEICRNQQEIEALQERGSLTPDTAYALSMRAAELVIEQGFGGGGLLRNAIDLLCRIATSDDPEIARAGGFGLFPGLIERLNDSFDPQSCALYDELFARLIEFCRRLPEARPFDEELRRFGLMDERAVLARKTRISGRRSPITDGGFFTGVRKVLLPSRVTIGADVAITSVLISKVRQVSPQAEVVLLGSPKLKELYGGDQGIRVREITYERGGGLLSRLNSWRQVAGIVQDECRGFGKDETILLDPDSRLTQLGLLPLMTGDHNYFLFESRCYQADSPQSIGELAAHWLGEILGNCDPAYPFISLPKEHRDFGQHIADRLRAGANRHLVALSFGVGGNQRKRIPDPFEEELIGRLLTDSKLILDKGAGNEEREQINRITRGIQAQGRTVVELNEANKTGISFQDWSRAEVVTWEGSIGAFAGMIAACNEYLGYDSAGQHIAAAAGVPTLTVFVNSNGARFANRWRPFGTGEIRVVQVEAGTWTGNAENVALVLAEVLALHQTCVQQQ